MAVALSETEHLIKRSRSFLKKRDFCGLSHFLTGKVPIFMGNSDLFYYLGLSHLYTKNFKSAEDYFKIGMENDLEHINIRLAGAVLALKQKQSSRALTLWLEILEIDPSNKKARKGLSFLKERNPSQESSCSLIRSRNFYIDKFGPSLPSYPMSKRFFLLMIFFPICVGILFIFIRVFFHLLATVPVPITRKISILNNVFSIKRKSSLIQEGFYYHFKFSSREVLEILNQVKRDFNNYRDNKLRFDLNKIKNSNASLFIKTETELLRSSLLKPNFSTLDTNYSFREVFTNPFLYDGIFVNWKGKIENVELDPEMIRCDFLIGYDKEQILEGRVPVVIPFEVFLDPSLPTEILGEIRLLKKGKIILYVTSIHQIIHRKKDYY